MSSLEIQKQCCLGGAFNTHARVFLFETRDFQALEQYFEILTVRLVRKTTFQVKLFVNSC